MTILCVIITKKNALKWCDEQNTIISTTKPTEAM